MITILTIFILGGLAIAMLRENADRQEAELVGLQAATLLKIYGEAENAKNYLKKSIELSKDESFLTLAENAGFPEDNQCQKTKSIAGPQEYVLINTCPDLDLEKNFLEELKNKINIHQRFYITGYNFLKFDKGLYRKKFLELNLNFQEQKDLKSQYEFNINFAKIKNIERKGNEYKIDYEPITYDLELSYLGSTYITTPSYKIISPDFKEFNKFYSIAETAIKNSKTISQTKSDLLGSFPNAKITTSGNLIFIDIPLSEYLGKNFYAAFDITKSLKTITPAIPLKKLDPNIAKKALQPKKPKPPEKGEPFTFVILSDTHVLKKSTLNAVQPVINLNPDIVIGNGDIINTDAAKPAGSTVQSQWKSFKTQVSDKFPGKYIPVAGNHDIFGYTDSWKNTFPTKFTNLQGEYPKYYSFDHKNSHFIILYGYKSRLSKTHMQWLRDDIQKAKGNYNHMFVFSHLGLFNPTPKYRTPGNILSAQNNELVSLFKESKAIVFSGHLHAYYKANYKSVPHIFAGSTIETRSIQGSTKQPSSFVVVDVTKDSINVKSLAGPDYTSEFDESKYFPSQLVAGLDQFSYEPTSALA